VASKPIVMVVEDDVEMNQLERELLEVYGLDSIAAYTGTEALDIQSRCHTDAILLDIMLPEMDGFETCRRLRGMNSQRVPVIILSALDSEECRRRGFEVGADAYFAKPFDPDEVVQKINALIQANGHAPRA
jgi:DNA-binding response OmpR family regulator